MASRPLRVAYVLLREPTYSETFIWSEINAVRAAGAEVAPFFARDRPRGRRAEAVSALRSLLDHPGRVPGQVGRLGASYGARALLASAYATALERDVAAFRPDVVHTHFVNLPTAVAVLVAERLGVPVTALAHAADFLLDGNPGALDRRVAALSHLFVISSAAATQLREKGVDLSRVSHSVVRAAFDGTFTDPPAHRAPGPLRIVTIARLIEKKGIDTAVAAVARLVAAGHPVRYDVYGDGPEGERLRQAVAADPALSGSVMLHGAAAHDVAMRALAGADLAVLPCRPAANGDVDGIPVVLMEAAARGVPVVTTAVSGIPELVTGDAGWLVPPNDAAALAAAIAHAAGAPDEAWRRSAALRARIRSEFAPGLQAQRLLGTWNALVETGVRR
ncbi:glycosyltransferase [Dactylosporangium sucinum]|uniref:Colanic acid biosynthesis glycosyltransferase WcaL n=1 Tax=Dactylosporangium sucinum TaxID=1424081 RepID=A0A917SZM6_9ACTN|nr:glycosyltransferase [Dactylosporangium sucinum]GGM05608.1 colanic acid biosynthesis glycosyltransferase WcaL [Dactylosporangium sucinum]